MFFGVDYGVVFSIIYITFPCLPQYLNKFFFTELHKILCMIIEYVQIYICIYACVCYFVSGDMQVEVYAID